jgi:hypothetical protein
MGRRDDTPRLPPDQALEIAEATALTMKYHNGRGLTDEQMESIVDKVYNRLVDRGLPPDKSAAAMGSKSK